MALARIEILEGRDRDEKQRLVDGVRAALSEALRAPATDPVVRLVEYPPSHFTIPYPDRHSELFTLVEVTMFAGRSLTTKRRLFEEIVSAVVNAGVPRNDVLIVVHEPPMHNWSVGGLPASEVEVGFKVDI